MKKLIIIAALLLFTIALSGCGAGSASVPEVEPNGNTVDLVIEATDFKFDQAEYRVKAGDTVNVTFKNAQGVHGIQIQGFKIKLKDGETATFVAAPGEYLISCNIMCGPGHSGMRSKLIVE